MSVPEKLLKPYDPKATEPEIYSAWEKSGYFNPDNLPGERKGTFSMVLPPPNATGTLHMGSALMLAVEDIMTRHARMQGKKTLWIPGTDHAAIATQSRVEKIIEKEEGKRRHDLGREELLRRIEKFVEENRATMVRQMKGMGASLDWSREAFTLDESRKKSVLEAFKQMYDAGLIYRGFRVVNWDPKGQTTVSDDEVEHREGKAVLYTFKYSKDFPISIATTRPETKVGDTAVAVHPEDPRYTEYVGKTFEISNFAGVPLSIKVIADESVEKDFGTGALGVTPAHSTADFELSQKHKLPLKQVINEFAKMNDDAGTLLAGKKTTEARALVVDWLKENNLLEKEEESVQNITIAERTGGIIEPLPKLQWFIDVNKPIKERGDKSLKELMQEAVSVDGIKILPDRFEKTYFQWINNLRDWCISRQIWYGHRIPVWYKGSEIYCGVEAPNDTGWEQDSDTLDTWFSSGLWTFSTLGWPDKTNDLSTYHPTTIIESGYDIIFFWIARMILMSKFFLGEVPFRTVYLHGLVRDVKGQKISKSLGNNIDPLDMIAKYGADAVRMSLIIGTSPGADSKMSEEKIKAYKLFANKLWNVARFVSEQGPETSKPEITDIDQTHITELNNLITEVSKEMDEYKFYLVGEKLYHYVWHTFADKIIEESKPIIAGTDELARNSRIWLLNHILRTCLKLLHPFMPFVTEELWSLVENPKLTPEKMLIISEWPTT